MLGPLATVVGTWIVRRSTHGPAGCTTSVERDRASQAGRTRLLVRSGARSEPLSPSTPKITARRLALAEPRRALGHGVQHRLEIGRRRGDDPQDLGGRGLLLQRLGDLAVALLKLGVALLQLLEQPGVLDRDHGLVRERLQQPDLLRR